MICEDNCPYKVTREYTFGKKTYTGAFCKKENTPLFRAKLYCEGDPVCLAVCAESSPTKSDSDKLVDSLGAKKVTLEPEIKGKLASTPDFKGGFIPDDGEKC